MRLIDADELKIDYGFTWDDIAPTHDEMYALIDRQPTIQPEPQWIPCSERLPKDEKKDYWICTNAGYQYQCRWTNINHFWMYHTTDWHWHIGDVPTHSEVIAWMPLPEPYKEV